MGFHTNDDENLSHRERRALRGFSLCTRLPFAIYYFRRSISMDKELLQTLEEKQVDEIELSLIHI